jgi:hypothetical protein
MDRLFATWKKRAAYRVLVGRRGGERPLGRCRGEMGK